MNILLDVYLEKNLGDDLFLESVLFRYPKHNFYVFTSLDYSIMESMFSNLKIVKLNKYFNFMLARTNKKNSYLKRFIKQKDIRALVSIGGSVFTEFNGWEKLYKERLSLWKYMEERDKKVFVLGSNFGPYHTNAFLEGYKRAFKFVEDICFRDRYSLELFKLENNIRQEADIIMNYPIDSFKELIEEDSIGISVINLLDRNDLASLQDEYIQKMVDLVNHFTLKQKKVYLLSFCEREGDEQMIETIIKRVEKRENQIHKLYYSGDTQEFLNIFSKIKQIIACRFHSIILAYVFDKEFFSLIYSEKSSDFINSYGLNNQMEMITQVVTVTPEQVENSFAKGMNRNKSIISGEKQYQELDRFLI